MITQSRFYKSWGLSALFCLITLSGCTEYWWTRGQPPSVATILSRSQEALATAIKERGSVRTDIAPVAQDLGAALGTAVTAVREANGSNEIAASLARCRDGFIKLEGNLSLGSRVPYGELSGQLRAFSSNAADGRPVEYPAFGVFAARTMFFLANELSVPQPRVPQGPVG